MTNTTNQQSEEIKYSTLKSEHVTQLYEYIEEKLGFTITGIHNITL
jgi:hypothetical protein